MVNAPPTLMISQKNANVPEHKLSGTFDLNTSFLLEPVLPEVADLLVSGASIVQNIL